LICFGGPDERCAVAFHGCLGGIIKPEDGEDAVPAIEKTPLADLTAACGLLADKQ